MELAIRLCLVGVSMVERGEAGSALVCVEFPKMRSFPMVRFALRDGYMRKLLRITIMGVLSLNFLVLLRALQLNGREYWCSVLVDLY